jgi:hypothetical protein
MGNSIGGTGPREMMQVIDGRTAAGQVAAFIDRHDGNVKAERTVIDGRVAFVLKSAHKPGLWSKLRHALGIQTRRSLTNEAFAMSLKTSFGHAFRPDYMQTVMGAVGGSTPFTQGGAGKELGMITEMLAVPFCVRPDYRPALSQPPAFLLAQRPGPRGAPPPYSPQAQGSRGAPPAYTPPPHAPLPQGQRGAPPPYWPAGQVPGYAPLGASPVSASMYWRPIGVQPPQPQSQPAQKSSSQSGGGRGWSGGSDMLVAECGLQLAEKFFEALTK